MDKNLATSRLKLMSHIRHNISPYTAEIIYKAIILPILFIVTMCSFTWHHQKDGFENIKRQALNEGNRDSAKLEKVSSIRKKVCALEVFKSLNGASPHTFQNNFTRVKHRQCTCANGKKYCFAKSTIQSSVADRKYNLKQARSPFTLKEQRLINQQTK